MYQRIRALCFVGCLFSPALQAEGLLSVYTIAEANDQQVKVADANRLAVAESKPQARAGLLPNVVLGANGTQSFNQENWLHGDDFESTTAGYNVSLSYALYRRDRQIAYDQTDFQIAAAEADFESSQQSLIERVASAYFGILSAKDNLRFSTSNKEAIQRQLDQTNQRFEVGLIAITDVQESQAAYDLANAEEIQAQNELDNAHESLREITGQYHEIEETLREDMPLLPPDPTDIEEWSSVALDNNPQIQAILHNVEVARQEVERQRAAKLPTVDLVGRHGYTDTLRGDESITSQFQTDNSIGVQLSYLLYEGGAIKSRTREAQHRYTQTLDQLEQQKRVVDRQVHNAYLNVLSNISRVKALKQALISTKTALDAIQTGFDVGTRTSVDVLNAQRDVFGAERNYASARYDYVVNTLRLKQAAGLIDREDLEAINAWLEILEPEEKALEEEEMVEVEIEVEAEPESEAME